MNLNSVKFGISKALPQLCCKVVC